MLKKILFLLFLASFTGIYAVEGMIIKTTDASFRDRWDKTLGKTAPRISGVNKLYKGQQMFLGAAITGYGSDSKSSVDVSYSVKITDPHGKVFLQEKNLKVISREIKHKDYVQMSDDFVTVAMGFDEPFGKYSIEMEITDKITGNIKKLTSDFEVIPLPDFETVKITGRETFSEWMSNYYKKQEPEKALPYFIYFSQSELTEREDLMLLTMSFFREIFSNNTFLFTQFPEAYNTADEKTKILMTTLMYNSVDRESFNNYFPAEEMQNLMTDAELPDIYSEITAPVYLDMLWAEFYACGKQKPILKLIQTLAYSRYKGSIEAFKSSKKKASDKEKALKEGIYQAAVWSLESHFQSDELVRIYANWLMNSDEIDDSVKRQLGAILVKFN